MSGDQPQIYHAIVQNDNRLLVVNELFADPEGAKGYIETVLTEKYDHDLAEWSDEDTAEQQDWDDGPKTWLAENDNWYIRTAGDTPRSGAVLAVTPHESTHEGLRSTGDLDLLPVEERMGDGVLRLDTTAEEHDVLTEVIEYRVGPAIDFFGIEDGQSVTKGFDPADLSTVMNACHDLQQEYAADGFYDMAKAADRVESKLGRFYVTLGRV
jgi:hypothetical protein